MSDLFNSEIVKEEINAINVLQKRLMQNTFSFVTTFGYEEKKHYVQMLKDLFEKQKILYMRFTLSDDPDAKEMIERMKTAAVRMGIPSDLNMLEIFELLDEKINDMDKSLDKHK